MTSVSLFTKLTAIPALLFFAFVPLFSAGAATSESYQIDSAAIGSFGTIEASSESYQTGTFLFGEEEAAVGGSGDSSGGGVSSSKSDSHKYTETGPLVLKDSESGTLAQELSDPQESITLHILSYASAQKSAPAGSTRYTLERIRPHELLPAPDVPETSILGAYEASAARNGEDIKVLRKLLTIILEGPAFMGAHAETHAVYYLHPDYKAWIKLGNTAFANDDTLIFQTPFVTQYLVARADISGKEAPAIIRTPETPPSATDNEIADAASASESRAIEAEIVDQGRDAEAPLEEDIQATSVPESFIDFLRDEYSSYLLPGLIALGSIGAALLTYAVYRRRKFGVPTE